MNLQWNVPAFLSQTQYNFDVASYGLKAWASTAVLIAKCLFVPAAQDWELGVAVLLTVYIPPTRRRLVSIDLKKWNVKL